MFPFTRTPKFFLGDFHSNVDDMVESLDVK